MDSDPGGRPRERARSREGRVGRTLLVDGERRAFSYAEHSPRHAAALLDTALEVAAATDLAGALRSATERAADLYPIRSTCIALSEDDDLIVRAVVGTPESRIVGRSIPRDDAPVWRVLTAEPGGGGGAPSDSTRWSGRLVLPIRRQGRTLGVLELRVADAEPDTEVDRDFFAALAALLAGPAWSAAQTREEVKLRRELSRALVDLDRASRARDQFLSVASHELKTPLTPIKAASQLLLRLGPSMQSDPARLARQLRAIDSQVDRMHRLVEDLIDAARLRSGGLDIRPESADLGDVVARVVGSWEESQRERIVLQIDGSLVGRWDRNRLEQVVANLVDNALKYSSSPDPVDVWVGSDTSNALVRVSDRGVGVPRAATAAIFDPFVRADNTPTKHYGGLGLGLYIAKEIVTVHGGDIRLESTEGGGSIFTVYLPLERQA